MSGKGSKPRPMDIPPDEFESNWDRIFGKKKNRVKEIEVHQLDTHPYLSDGFKGFRKDLEPIVSK